MDHQGDGGLYSVIWIPFLDPDYGNRPPKLISLVVMGHGRGSSLSVWGLELVVLLLRLIIQKTSPTLWLVSVVITSYQEVYCLVGDFLQWSSVAGSAPVEHPHKINKQPLF